MSDQKIGWAALSLIFPVGPVIAYLLDVAIGLARHLIPVSPRIETGLVFGLYFALLPIFVLFVGPRYFNHHWQTRGALGVGLIVWSGLSLFFLMFGFWQGLTTFAAFFGHFNFSSLFGYLIVACSIAATVWFISLFFRRRA